MHQDIQETARHPSKLKNACKVMTSLYYWCFFFLFLFILFPLLCRIIHFLPRQSILFYIIPHSVQSSSLRSSSLPSPLYFHFHHPPSYAVILSSHHMHIPSQPPFVDFLGLPLLSLLPYSFISFLVSTIGALSVDYCYCEVWLML